MKVAVVGLWHLGCVTAACLAKLGHEVIGYDPLSHVISELQHRKPPIFEPGLTDLISEGIQNKKLSFTTNTDDLRDAEIVWVTFDTPVDDEDKADTQFVMLQVEKLFPVIQDNAVLIISSQLPVGTASQLQARFKTLYPAREIAFAVMPENLRLGKAIEIFTQPDRMVIGLDNVAYQPKIEVLLAPINRPIIWMTVASAEMTKHAINSFLALSVTFINELASLCEQVGANAEEVERGLKTEERIGPKAYVRAGDAIAGGTLMRDIQYLIDLGKREDRQTFLLSAVVESNNYHKEWSQRKILHLLESIRGKKIAMLGLTYKAGTDTLRRSTAVEICEWLYAQGAIVTAFDPSISKLPDDLAKVIQLKQSATDALEAAEVAVLATPWPEFKELSADEFVKYLKQPRVLDASGFIAKNLKQDQRIHYCSVGVSA